MMTSEETIEILEEMWELLFNEMRNSVFHELQASGELDKFKTAFDASIEALKAEPCEGAIDPQALRARFNHLNEVYEGMSEEEKHEAYIYGQIIRAIDDAPPVIPKQKLCKDCKFFEYDSVAKVNGIPLIVAHEICNRWGDGCKTKEDGYCFLFEPKTKGESDET